MNTDPASHDDARARRRTAWVLAALIGIALAVRVYAAWQERDIMVPDAGVVALMARDMAAGAPWPTFFYGQPYMGSLEPAFSALLCLLFGTSGFMVNLGTALIGLLLIPVVYLWGRDAGGRVAGLAAAAFCVLGTHDSFHYMISPRGGYAALVVLTAALLWQTPRLAWQVRQGAQPRLGYLLLGLLAGLAWWVHQLSIELLVSCALLTLMLAGLRILRPALLGPALLGFFLGSAPFWIWNATHQFETLRFLHESGHAAAAATLYDFLLRGRRWLGVEHAPAALQLLIGGACAALVLAAALRIGHAARRRTWTEREGHLASALLLPVFSYLFFTHATFSTFHTARYLVPLVPAFALLGGILAAEANRGGWRWLAVLPVLVIAAPAPRVLAEYRPRAANGAIFRTRAREVADFLQQVGAEDAFGPFHYHAFNFLADARIRILVPENDHVVAHMRRAETARHIAVLSNHDGVEQFLETAGGRARIGAAGGVRIQHTFAAPAEPLAEIPPARWQSDDAPALCDGRLDTGWRCPGPADTNRALELQFVQPQVVSAVRLQAAERTLYPQRWRIEGRETPDGPWRTLLREQPVTPYFWSGPRFFCHGYAYRLQARFAPQPLQALRICFGAAAPPRVVAELSCFGPGPHAPAEEDALPALLDTLQTAGVRRLYADRWVGNEVRARSGGAIACPGMRFWMEPGWREADVPVEVASGTALLVRTEDLPACRRALAHAPTAAWTEQACAPWCLLRCDATPAVAPTNLVWLGPLCAAR
jgi:4-amino-4-deoxy-L-arabinose transferase-like glycosyltransferase